MCAEMLLLEPMVRRLVTGNEFPEPLIPVEQSSSMASPDFDGARAASISHMKTSAPRPPDATILL